jgi:aminopeptidase N
MQRSRSFVALAVTALVTAGAAAPAGAAPAGQNGRPSVDATSIEPPDPYFPGLGNAGYDVDHYDLALRTAPTREEIEGVTTITAHAGKKLPRFDLDLLGFDVRSVLVNGKAAQYTRRGRELRIRPARAIAPEARFAVVVRYRGVPEQGRVDSIGLVNGWLDLGDQTAVLGEPDAASRWFPANDHPRDKATFTFRVTVPEGLVAVANGTLRGQSTAGAETTWVWSETEPMATYLAQLGVGDFELDERAGPDGVTIRNALSSSFAEAVRDDLFNETSKMLSFFSSLFGRYPFDVYGVIAVDAPLGFSLESQTLTLADRNTVTDPDQGSITLAHELVHQWFGDWITPSNWRDIWLNEGFATYGQWLWADHALGVPLSASIAQARLDVARLSDIPTDDPGVKHLFGTNSYERGALTLDALRKEVGDDTFFRILRTYLQRFGGKNAATDDFIKVAEDVAGRPLDQLFDAWLHKGPLPFDPESAPTA